MSSRMRWRGAFQRSDLARKNAPRIWKQSPRTESRWAFTEGSLPRRAGRPERTRRVAARVEDREAGQGGALLRAARRGEAGGGLVGGDGPGAVPRSLQRAAEEVAGPGAERVEGGGGPRLGGGAVEPSLLRLEGGEADPGEVEARLEDGRPLEEPPRTGPVAEGEADGPLDGGEQRVSGEGGPRGGDLGRRPGGPGPVPGRQRAGGGGAGAIEALVPRVGRADPGQQDGPPGGRHDEAG